MENASKALLIAAGVVIVLLIIALGVWIFGFGKNQMDASARSFDEQQLAALNNPFTQYQGKQRGANVSALLGRVITHNANADKDDTAETISVESKVSGNTLSNTSDSSQISNLASSFASSGKTYTVTIQYATSGLVNHITIT